MEDNITDIWLRKDPIRWIAGGLAGIVAGAIAFTFAGILSTQGGLDFMFPAKVLALPIYGGDALAFDAKSNVVLTGLILFEGICAILGVAYAHFTGTNSFLPLLGVGISWGAFVWIFVNNLWSPSFRDIFVAQVSSGAAFFVCMTYGISLTSVAAFDRMFRKSS